MLNGTALTQTNQLIRENTFRLLSTFTKALLVIISIGLLPAQAQRDNNNNYLDSLQAWSLHFQSTVVLQGHSRFRDKGYAGRNSLSPQADTALSVTATLFLGRRLWSGAALYINPEISGGRGVGHRDSLSPYNATLYTPAVGIAGFPNGETFRIGTPAPALYLARFYIEQVFPLSNEGLEDIVSEANQIKQTLPASRIVITAGKFSLADIFDNNTFAHDARVQFLNWSLMSMGAWDYAANTRGYTWSIAAEYIRPAYAFRVAGSLMPVIANGNVLDWNIGKAGALQVELERQVRWLPKPATFRLLAFRNVTKAPSYQDATQQLLVGTYPTNPDYIMAGKEYGGVKFGFGLNLEQPLGNKGGLFGRISWNDGHTATWAFTEIDRSYTIGAVLGGYRWRRPNDAVGLALAQNDISADHTAFLNAGGYSFMIGDGRLPHYGSEQIFEAFYKARLARTLWLTLDYQFVRNPGYNLDSGTVNLLAIRTHIEF